MAQSDSSDSSDDKRVVYVSVDGGMGSDLVNMRVLDRLNSIYGSLYTNQNVLISGTHTHSGRHHIFIGTLQQAYILHFLLSLSLSIFLFFFIHKAPLGFCSMYYIK